MPTINEMIEVMQAFERGETIEFKVNLWPDEEWKISTTPSWDWRTLEYRVKPKDVYVWWRDSQSSPMPYDSRFEMAYLAAGYRKAKLVFEGE